jgi:ELWxxDGT repeat protein
MLRSAGSLALLVLLALCGLGAGPAYRVKDINKNPVPVETGFATAAAAGNSFYFSGAGGLWKSDGSAPGTALVAPAALVGAALLPGAPSPGGLLFFLGSDTGHGRELWRTDGSPGGTVLLRDIAPGRSDSYAQRPVAFGDAVYFGASDGTRGYRLWKTDGTPDRTVLAADFPAGPRGFIGLAAAGGRLWFAATSDLNPAKPYAVYQSDGTVAGTRFVSDFAGEVTSPVCAGPCIDWPPGSFVEMQGLTYFIASDGVSGLELWRTDGTVFGTSRVKDICPGRCSGFLYSDGVSFGDSPALQIVGAKLFFFADDGVHGMEPWTSDGTEQGTRMVKDIMPGPDSSSFGVLMTSRDGVVFFPADDGTHGYELWRSDGNESGTFLVADLNPGAGDSGIARILFSGPGVFLVTQTTNEPFSLWRTTPAGVPPTLLASNVFSPGAVADVEGTLFVSAVGPDGISIWRSDGSAAGTFEISLLVAAENSSSMPAIAGGLSDRLIFGANDGRSWSLWSTDGAESRTALLSPVGFTWSLDSVNVSALFHGSLFFSGDDGVHGVELWRTDGTPDGTRMVKDIGVPGTQFPFVHDSSPCGLQTVGTFLYFRAFDGEHGLGLWKTDGTESGTRFVSGAIIGCTEPIVPFAGRSYFGAYDQNFEPGLWRTDGTPEGTERIRSIAAISLTAFAGRLFFVGYDNTESGLFVSDGTAAGTALFQSGIRTLVRAGDLLFLVEMSDDNPYAATLWSSDGTRSGTVRLSEFAYPPAQFLALGRRLFFVAADSEHGFELWTSDGTPAGTHVVKDIFPGPDDSSPSSLTAINGVLLFSALDPVHGAELWRSDGTEEGTWLVDDIVEGPGSSSPAGFTLTGSLVYFTADDGRTGTELWAVPLSAIHPPPVRLPRRVPWRR